MDKKQIQFPQVSPKDETLIRTMPEKYVGVSLKATLQGVRQGIVVDQTQPAAPKITPPPVVQKPPIISAPPVKKSPPGIFIFGGLILVLIGVVLVFFLYPRKKVELPINTTTAPVVVTPPVNTAPPVETVAITTPPEFSGPIRNASDQDADGLTDREEQEVYKTELGNPDTDRDGYLDGSEVFYLYNPAAVAPTTLLASGIVRQTDNPTSAFSVYTPALWAITQELNGLVATGQTGEFVQITSQTIPLGLSLMDWYLQSNPTIDRNAVMTFVNRAGLMGIKASDGLAAYFVANDRVYIVSYVSAERKELSYRRTFEMMVNSFKVIVSPSVAQEISTSTPEMVKEATTTSTIISTSTVEEVNPVSNSVLETNANATSTDTVSTSTTP